MEILIRTGNQAVADFLQTLVGMGVVLAACSGYIGIKLYDQLPFVIYSCIAPSSTLHDRQLCVDSASIHSIHEWCEIQKFLELEAGKESGSVAHSLLPFIRIHLWICRQM